MPRFRGFVNQLFRVGVIGCFVIVAAAARYQGASSRAANGSIPSAQARDISRWRSFTSKGGWTVRYPPNWKISSCANCTGLTVEHIFVMFSDPSSSKEHVWVEQFIDKPAAQSVDNWLRDLSQDTNLNTRLGRESISLDGRTALRVKYTATDDIYVVNGPKSFATRNNAGQACGAEYPRSSGTAPA